MIRILFLAPVVFAAACVGEAPTAPTTSTASGDITYLDTDSDGAFDAIDTNRDGGADYFFESQVAELHPVAFCANPLIDLNGDGHADGLDWNCDGIIDVPFASGGGGTSSTTCSSTVGQNGETHQVKCTSSGGTYSCSCLVNGSEVSTCSTTSNSACSIPGNCCGF